HGRPRGANRDAGSRRVPRLGLRHLRPALGYDLAARHRQFRADRGGAGRRRHSGAASGIVASSFPIARQLLSWLEDEVTGEIRPRDFHVDIPRERVEQARAVAATLGRDLIAKYPFVSGMRPVSDDPVELLLNNTWRPALAITGAAGLPLPRDGGNVLRPQTTLKPSLPLPPTCHADPAARKLEHLLAASPPYAAPVT